MYADSVGHICNIVDSKMQRKIRTCTRKLRPVLRLTVHKVRQNTHNQKSRLRQRTIPICTFLPFLLVELSMLHSSDSAVRDAAAIPTTAMVKVSVSFRLGLG